MISAIWPPPKLSRTIETAMTRVDAAPMPWMKRKRKQRSRKSARARRQRPRRHRCRARTAAAPRRPNRSDSGPIDKHAQGQAAEIGGDDILPVVFVLDAEAGADLLQAGQHDVDGQRVERHQRRGERDEFPPRNLQPAAEVSARACWSIGRDSNRWPSKQKCAGRPAHLVKGLARNWPDECRGRNSGGAFDADALLLEIALQARRPGTSRG